MKETTKWLIVFYVIFTANIFSVHAMDEEGKVDQNPGIEKPSSSRAHRVERGHRTEDRSSSYTRTHNLTDSSFTEREDYSSSLLGGNSNEFSALALQKDIEDFKVSRPTLMRTLNLRDSSLTPTGDHPSFLPASSNQFSTLLSTIGQTHSNNQTQIKIDYYKLIDSSLTDKEDCSKVLIPTLSSFHTPIAGGPPPPPDPLKKLLKFHKGFREPQLWISV